MAAGSGLTAAADASITLTLVGTTSGAYATPSTNGLYCALYTTQFTAATKAGATEWSSGSDTNYARQQVGTTPSFGWTVNAYASGTGVLFTNTATITQPAVAGTGQTLFSFGFCSALTAGTIALFADLASSQVVNVGVQVIIAAYTTPGTGAAFTSY